MGHSRFWKKIDKKIAVFLLIILAFVWFLEKPTVFISATSPWTQTDWSGGSGQTDWSDNTKYSSSSSISNSTAGQLSLSTTTNWYDTDWGYRKKITIDASKVSGASSFFSFPVLINTTDTDWKDTTNGGNVGKSDGGDILFTASDGTTRLDHEIEKYDSATGELVTWVEVTTLQASSNTDIYIYYGNSGASDQQNAEGVWGSNYLMVQHLQETGDGTAGEFVDSTSNNNDGQGGGGTGSKVPSGTSSGRVDGAQVFDDTAPSDYIDVANSSSLNNSGSGFSDLTLSLWVKTDDNSLATQYALSKDGSGANSGDASFVYDSSLCTADRWCFYAQHPSTVVLESTGSAVNDTWYYVAVVIDSNTGYLYIDGTQHDTTGSFPGDIWDNTTNLQIGSVINGTVGFDFSGTIDEVRVINTPRSLDWVKTEYNNQSSPGTFYSVASEENTYVSSGNLTSSIFDTEQASDFGTLTYSTSTPTDTSVSVKVRTSDNSDMSGATDFSSCTAISSGNDMSANSCVTDSDRYVQYYVELSTTDQTATPVFQDISIPFSLNATPTPTPTPTPISSPWTQTDWDGGTGQTAWSDETSYDSGSSVDHTTSGQVSLARTYSDWLDHDYAKRKQITLTNNSSEDLAADIPITISVDTSSLSSLQSDCDDLRIGYGTSSQSELSRYYDAASGASNCSDSSSTLVIFPLQNTISASGNSNDYYLYYSNAGASTPSNPEDGYDVGSANSLLGVRFNGDTVGAAGESATESGPLTYQDSQTVENGSTIPKGAFVERNITNKITNPSFENATYDTNWQLSTVTQVYGQNTNADVTVDVKDNFIQEQIKTNNAGAYGGWHVGIETTAGTDHKGLVEFDLSSIPAGANTTSATFSVYGADVKAGATSQTCYEIASGNAGWPQGDENWAVGGDGDSTWNKYDAGTPGQDWAGSAGLSTAGTDYINTAIVTWAPALGWNDASFSDASVIDDWYGTSNENYGMLCVANSDPESLVKYFSSDYVTDTTLRPKLSLTYTQVSKSKNTTASFVKNGNNSAKIVSVGSSANALYTNINAGNTNKHALSAYVYDSTSGNEGGTVDSSTAELYYNGSTITTSYENVGSGWWRLSGTLTAANASRSYGVSVKSGKTVYIDAVQLEELGHASTYTDGSLGDDYSWSSTANNSTSTRAAVNIEYSASTANISATSGTVSFWLKTDWAGDDSYEHNLFAVDTSSGSLRLYKDSDNSLKLTDGSNTATKSVSWSADTWQYITAHWGSSDLQVYVNASSGTAPGAFSAPTINTAGSIYVGSNTSGTTGLDGVVSDFRIWDAVLTSAQITDIYNARQVSSNLGSEQSDTYTSSGTLTSSIYDAATQKSWGTLTYTATTPTNTAVTVKVRTSSNSNMSGATAFSGCTGISSGSDISENSCVTDGDRYIQYQATLSTSDQTNSPDLTEISITYEDYTAPVSTSFSQSAPPDCFDDPPASTPTVYSAVIKGQSAVEVFFTKSSGPLTGYLLEYGNSPDNFQFGADNIGGPDTSSYQINSLSRNTTYYFRIRGVNGCAVSAWSNLISATTKGLFFETQEGEKEKNIAKHIKTDKPKTQESQKKEEQGEYYDLTMYLKDTDGMPLGGVEVRLYSEPRVAHSDENGKVFFPEVLAGEHHMEIIDAKEKGSQTIFVTGESKDIEFTFKIKKTNPFTDPMVQLPFGILGLTILLLFIKIYRLKKEK